VGSFFFHKAGMVSMLPVADTHQQGVYVRSFAVWMTAGSVVVYYTWVWLQQTSGIMDTFCQSLEICYNKVLLLC